MPRTFTFSNRAWKDNTDKDESTWRWNLSRLFAQQIREMSERAEQSDWSTVEEELPKFIKTEDLSSLYEQKYVEQGEKYYVGIRSQMEKGWKPAMRTKQLSEDDPYFIAIRSFINDPLRGTAGRVKSVNNVSRNLARAAITSAIREAREQGLGARDATKLVDRNVKRQWRITQKFRAARIARTEVGIIANRASLIGAEETGVEFQKEWIAFIDDRTRQAHIEANGTTAPKEGTFLVDGDRIQGPLDPTASPANMINCRCRLGYQVD